MSDRDPIRDLENFSLEGDPVQPLPASEVRRRGDRLRHRRQGLIALSAAAAVVLIAAPLAYVANGTGRADPDPTLPRPSETEQVDWLKTIPEEFPVTAGMPEEIGGARLQVQDLPQGVDVCGWRAPELRGVDAVSADYSPVMFIAGSRTLWLHKDDEGAAVPLAKLEDVLAACDREGGSRTYAPTETELGEDSVQLVVHNRDTADGEYLVYSMVRVGNAVLTDWRRFQLKGTDAVQAEDAVAEASRQASAVVDKMCVFAAEPCPQDEVSGQPSTGTSIPDGFPLNRGQRNVEDGSTPTPTRDGIGVLPVQLCGDQRWPADPTDRLLSTTDAPEHIEARELATFADAATAVEVMSRLRKSVRDCPKEPTTGPGGEQTNWVHTELERDPGYESLTWSRALEGGQTPGLQVHQLVRVGNAILALSLTTEATQTTAPAQADELTAYSRKLAPELCVFTEDGC